MRNILFITHETSRTGAPFVLLYFLQWLKEKHPEVNFSILALKGGGLKEEFQKLSLEFIDFSSFNAPEITFKQELLEKLLKKFGKQRKKIKEEILQELAAQNFDLIYANTVVSVPVAIKIKSSSENAKLLVHVHEMKTVISLSLSDFAELVPNINLFIAASEAVKQNLVKEYGALNANIRKINDFSLQKQSKKQEKKTSGFLVGGSGTVHWRKGSDLFLQVAQTIKKKYPDVNIKFQWIGAIPRAEKIIFKADIEKAELSEIISFKGEQKNPDDSISQFDVFLLPSREDPFPLVAIEAGMQAKPIICFEKATGAAEILKNGGGYIVPYLDIEAMADKIIFYYRNPEALLKDGEKARQLFSEYVPEKICSKIFETIKEVKG